MRRNLRHMRLMALLMGMVFLFGGANASANQEEPTMVREQSVRSKQILVEMVSPPVLRLGEPLEFTITVQPLIDAPDVALRWVLPEGVTMLEGALNESLGTLAAGQVVTFQRQLRVDTLETVKIGVEATFTPNPSAIFGDAAILYLTVGDQGGSVAESDPHRIARLRERIPLGPDASVSAAAAGTQPNAVGTTCFTIVAQFTRTDKVWDGVTQQTRVVPITSASVEIWEDD